MVEIQRMTLMIQKILKLEVIILIFKDILLVVTSQHDVIHTRITGIPT